MAKRFSISELRVVDSDEDSDDLPSVTEFPNSSAMPRAPSAQGSHRTSGGSLLKKSNAAAGGEEMYLRSGEAPVPSAEPSPLRTKSVTASTVVVQPDPPQTHRDPVAPGLQAKQCEEPSFAIAVHEDSAERPPAAVPEAPSALPATSSGGDMMEGRRRRSGSGPSQEPSFVVVDSNPSTLGSRVASLLGSGGGPDAIGMDASAERRLDGAVRCPPAATDATSMPNGSEAPNVGRSVVDADLTPQQRTDCDDGDETEGASSVLQFRSGSMSPPIRMHGGRRHMTDPREGAAAHPTTAWGGQLHAQDVDSDNESVQFVELTSNGESRELSHGAKPCAVVLEDGREVTPDSYASNSDNDQCADTRRPDMPLLVIPEDRDGSHADGRMPTTNRGESLTSRLTARSSSATGMSLYRQRLLERQQAEERQRKEELERQWQELTFQPQVGHHQPMGYSIDMVNAQPYYQRLYAEAAKKRDRRKSTSRQSIDRTERKPKLNEKTVEMAGYRYGDIFERLYPGKLKKPPPTPTPVCGTKEVFARLTKAAARDAGRQPHFKEEVYPFAPEITEHAKQLTKGVNIVERLYKPSSKNASKMTPRGGAP